MRRPGLALAVAFNRAVRTQDEWFDEPGDLERVDRALGAIAEIDDPVEAVLTLGDATVGRATFEPGWKWSECVKPVAGTDTCQVAHLGYVVSGHMHVVMDDGAEGDAAPGDLFEIAPGHDAWIVGDEPCVLVDFQGAPDYAKP